MVVILMGPRRDHVRSAGLALSAELGWPLADAADPKALHPIVATVLGRREHLVVVSPALSPDAQQTVRGGLPRVRFVNLTDDSANPEEIVRAVRREFGL